MSPADIYHNDQLVTTLGPNSDTIEVISGVVITYFGDEFRGYGITEDGQPVDSGQLPTDHEVVASVRSRLVPHIDKGQLPTLMSERIKLKFRSGKES